MVYITKSVSFSAAHRLCNPELSDEENMQIYDKCNNFNGHGHNYTLEVTVSGLPDIKTGYLLDLKQLKQIINFEIVDKVDHKHLNFDVPFLEGIIPTVENLAVIFWEILKNKLPSGKLFEIKLSETDNSWVRYRGEPIEIARFKTKNKLRTDNG
jgi:6-pyruvoyltetrahydropterin/6-carboxytetrahydropterin synthase